MRCECQIHSTSGRLLKILPYAGALPFVCGAIALMFGITTFPILGSVEALILSYGLAIISFMAGVHWGQYLSGVSGRTNLLITSNVTTLLAWLGYNLLSAAQFAVLLMVLFTALLAIDRQLDVQASTDRSYFRTRAGVTILVLLSLMPVAFLVR
jgi:Protein of unknown function (DUF3429)